MSDQPVAGPGMIRVARRAQRWLAMLALAALAGCGGSEPGGAEGAAASRQAPTAKSALAAASVPRPESGWYWNPDEGGTGFMFEAQGDRGFVGLFVYEEGTGKPIWYAATGTVSVAADGRAAFVGDLRRYQQGMSITQDAPGRPYVAPQTSQSVGELRIDFIGRDASAQLPGGRHMQATRFDIAGRGYDFDHPVPTSPEQPETGWYWNPAQPGRGYAVEVQNNIAFVGVFHYNEDGTPAWQVTTVDMTDGVQIGRLMRYRDGQTLASTHRAPTGADTGDAMLSFRSACAAAFQFDQTEPVALQRYRIDGSTLADGDECRALAAGRLPVPTVQRPARLLANVPAYGAFVSLADVHVYALSEPAAASSALRPTVRVTALDNGEALPYETVSASPSSTTGRLTHIAVRAEDVGLRRYRLVAEVPSGPLANHMPACCTPLAPGGDASPLVGQHVGSFSGRQSGSLRWTLRLDGRVTATWQPDAGPSVELAGSVSPRWTVALASADGMISVQGHVNQEGRFFGTWWDAGGPGGPVSIAALPTVGATTWQVDIRAADAMFLGVAETLGARVLPVPPAVAASPRLQWRVAQAPGGSAGTLLAGARSFTPTFTPDLLGDYTIELSIDTGRGFVAVASRVVKVFAAPAFLTIPGERRPSGPVAIGTPVLRSTSPAPPRAVPEERVARQVVRGMDGWQVTNHGHYARSSDGGLSWVRIGRVPIDPAMTGEIQLGLGTVSDFWVMAASYWTGWPRIFRTKDAGASWSEMTLPENPNTGYGYGAITVIDEQTVIVGGAVVIVTRDGGATWETKAFRPDQVMPSGTMWSLQGGDVLRTTDLARTEQRTRLLGEGKLVAVSFANETTGLALGLGPAGYELWRTQSGGSSWLPLPAQGLPRSHPCPGWDEHRIRFADSPDSVTIAFGFLCLALSSADAGLTWR